MSIWAIADRLKNKHKLTGSIEPGDTVVVTLPPTVQLGNSGGLITLLNKEGLKVDGVTYNDSFPGNVLVIKGKESLFVEIGQHRRCDRQN